MVKVGDSWATGGWLPCLMLTVGHQHMSTIEVEEMAAGEDESTIWVSLAVLEKAEYSAVRPFVPQILPFIPFSCLL